MRAVNRDSARRALEHGKAVRGPGCIECAVDAGPLAGACTPGAAAAFDGAIARGLAAVPELHVGAAVDQQVDLVTDSGLQVQVAGRDVHRQAAQQQAVVGQAAGVVDQAVDTRTEAADIRDVEGAVQSQVAVDLHQRRAARGGRAEARIQVGVGIEQQRTGGQGRAGIDGQMAAVGDAHVAQQSTGTTEGGTTAHRHVGAGQGTIDEQAAGVDLGVPGHHAEAAEGQGACAVFGQVAEACHDAVEGAVEVIVADAQGAAGPYCGKPGTREGAQAGAAAQVQGRTARQVDPGADTQCSVAQRGEAARLHIEQAVEGVSAGQAHIRRAGFDQATAAGQHAGQGQVIVESTHGQPSVEVDRIGQYQRRAVSQRGRAVYVQGAGTQGRCRAQGQRAGVEGGAALEGVDAIEGQVGRAVFAQASRAGDQATQGQVIAAGDGEVGVKHDAIAHTQRCRVIQGRRAANGEVAQTKGGGAAQGQRTGVQGGATQVGVGAAEDQIGRALLGQAARTVDCAAERQVSGAADAQVASQIDRVGGGNRRAGVQCCAAGGVQHARAQRRIAGQDQPACVQGHRAQEGIGAAECQVCRAVLHQTTDATDGAIERQCVAAADRQAAAEYRIIAQGYGGVAVQCGARRSSQGASTQRGVAADHQGTAIEQGATGVAVGAIEHQRAGIEFVQNARAGDIDAEGGSRQWVDAHGEVAAAGAQLPTGAIDQAVAIGDELQTGDGLYAIHADSPRSTLEHRKATAPGLVGKAVGRGPVGAPRCPGAVATVDSAVGKGVAAVPETNIRRRYHQVDLAAH